VTDEIRIGTRGSALALAQSRTVAETLERAGERTRLVIVRTDGDQRAPDTAWGEGAFVAAIERELLAGRVDLAVHSAKDVPVDEDARLRIAAFLPRADPRDALVVRGDATARRLDDLPAGTRVGTDSPRRTGFLLARRPDLRVHPLHGNVDSRLRRLDAAETDALVLACAGLDRLGLGDRIAERIDPEIIPPAPGQGALAIQIRRDDARLAAVVGTIDDTVTRLAVEGERAFLAASGGGCRSPIGALATVADEQVTFLAGSTRPDGSAAIVGHRRGPRSAVAVFARELAGEVALGRPHVSRGPRVLVTRPVGQADELVAALTASGLDAVPVPTIAVELEPAGGDLDAAVRRVIFYRWVVVTSTNGARAILKAAERVFTPFEATRFAVVGAATRRALEDEGVEVEFESNDGTAAGVATELPVEPGDWVLVVRGNLADGELPVALRARGASVHDVIAYRTSEAPAESGPLLRAAIEAGPIAAVLFTSGSTVRGLLALAAAQSLDVRAIPAVCIGPAAARAATDAGFNVLAIAASTEAAALASAAAQALLGQPAGAA
jgi:hydroxymethylbilane synthase